MAANQYPFGVGRLPAASLNAALAGLDYQPVAAGDGTTQSAFANTSPSPGTPAVGVAFVVPPSGKMYVSVSGSLEVISANAIVQLGFEMRTGPTIGAGAVLLSPGQGSAVSLGRATATFLNATWRDLITGTPGASVNIRLAHWVTVGSGTIWTRKLIVEPVT